MRGCNLFSAQTRLGSEFAVVDAHHAELDERFREIERAIFLDQPSTQIVSSFDTLVQAFESYFQDEERMLDERASPILDLHREDHMRLLVLARKIRSELAATSGQRSIKALFDIEDAFFRHVIQHDLESFREVPIQALRPTI